MSYCRFSCDNWMSDIYCYEHVDGFWAIHVAGNRRVREPQPTVDMTKPDWIDDYRANMADLETIATEPIGLPHDGEDFDEPTPEACRDRLLMLREAGYRVPEHAIESLEEEMKESAL